MHKGRTNTEKLATYQPRTEASEGVGRAITVVLDFQLPEFPDLNAPLRLPTQWRFWRPWQSDAVSGATSRAPLERSLG